MQENKDKKGRGQESKQRILDTAVVLFSRYGYDRTGLRQLATEAEVNLSMINYFFGSKKKLLLEILERFFSRYLEIAQQTLAGSGDFSARMRLFIAESIAFFDQQTDYLLVAITELHHDDPEITKFKAGWGQQMVAIQEKQFCKPLAASGGALVSAKLMTPLLTSIMASRFLFSPVMSQLTTVSVQSPEIDEYAAIVADIFLHGSLNLRGMVLEENS